MVKCQYKDDRGIPCNNWFHGTDTNESLCPIHAGIISDNQAYIPAVKNQYIEVRNAHMMLVREMNDEQLDLHLAQLEAIIELNKVKAISARAVKSERLQSLSDDERAERRKIKVNVDLNGKVIPKKESVKLDPVEKMIQKLMLQGLSRESALKLMED